MNRPSSGFTGFGNEATEQSISERFEQQALRHPDRIAVKTAREALTYAQLSETSHRVAHGVLNEIGEGSTPVALVVEHGASLVGAVLGVLAAGRPYVGLDSSHPRAELSRVLRDSGPGLIVTDRGNRRLAAELAGELPILEFEGLDASRSAGRPEVGPSPDSAAYIYYTSGTTGEPKGVIDNHRNVLHNVMRYTNSLKIGAEDRLTLLQSVAFSGSVSSLFCAVLNGATCFPYDLRREGISKLACWIVDQGITVWHSVPAVFRSLLETGLEFPSLRVIRLEGDSLSRRHVELFQARFDRRCTLVNGLGATETGLSRQYFIGVETEIAGDVVPVGYPVEGMEALVLDDSGAELAPGEVGEVAIKSRHLAIGYRGRPELTAARFAPGPSGGPERIYRTGDLGRMAPDGCLELVGRADHGIKLHGRWVDLRAIEAALTRLPGVKEAIVVASEAPSGDLRLAGYVVASVRPGPTAAGLTRALAAARPELSLPVRCVVLDELPLDTNGKVSRRELPDPHRRRPGPDSPPFAEPRTDTERILAEIWSEVLEFDGIGIDDPFFELGGDSLQALSIVLGIEKRLGAQIPPSAVLDAPSIAAMARLLERERHGRCLVAMRRSGAGRPVFCIHGITGDVIDYRELATRLGTDRPVFGLRARGLDGKQLPFARVEPMAAHYIDEIRTVQPEGPYVIAGNCFGGVIAFEIAAQLAARGERVERLFLLDTAYPRGLFAYYLDQLRIHLRRLARKSGRERVAHIGALARRRVDKIGSAVATANARARNRYRPRPYDGPVVVVCPGPPHNQLGWKTVVTPEPRVVELPYVEGRELLQEPYVGDLADLLSRSLGEPAGSPRSSSAPRGAPRKPAS